MLKKALLISIFLPGYLSVSQAQTGLTLQQALHTAQKNNPFLKPEQLNTNIAQSDVITAGLRPNISLNNQTLQLMNDKYFATGTQFQSPHNRQVWWQVTKPFQLANQRKYKQEVAIKNVAVTEKNYAGTELSVLLETGNKWLDVWYNKVNLDLVEKAKGNIDSLVTTQLIRLKNQVISESDLARTQLLAEQYQLQLQQAVQSYQSEAQHLQLLTGNPDTVAIDTEDPVITLSITEQLDSLLNLSYQQRPDIQVAQNTIEAAKSNIKLQRALAIPVPEMGVIYNPQNTVPYFGFFGTIDLPFFSRNQGEIKKSKFLLQQSEQSFSAVKQQIKTDVQTAFSAYLVNKEAIRKYSGILGKSTQVLTSVKYAYARGGTTIIDFLEAQRTWFDTRKMYYTALYDYRKSYLQLLYVTGLINQL
ncbi:outer membrane protein, cobalt-zinc-cadmium efflux system [Chitinophaga arvensicola]|uniref:Outer membrane protein, cobalt-zinc-cadmium efflux system n=2 Tax=Chitinophaga arvensicola TaxID=29529 RepID=A0A1I0RS40_9BACT|nr:outer membrane protein, cobalt-zinc-cadmium efflux system [Chitinophaga arvensicola]